MPTDVLTRPVEAEARLRNKNQLTLPEEIVAALDARVNDRLVFEIDPDQPGSLRVRLVPRSFAGSLTGVFGSAEETAVFVRDERASWEA